jgi:transcriptional regulator with XRE-family HTH domain
MGMAKKIRLLMVERDVTAAKLAEMINTSQSNISNKLKRDNFSENELNEIADALGAKFEAYFVLEDGRKF